MKKIKEMENKATDKMNSWQNNIALFAVTIQVNELRNKYKKFPKIQTFLKDVQKDVLTNLNDFIEDEKPNNMPAQMQMAKNANGKPWDKYKVNLLITQN